MIAVVVSRYGKGMSEAASRTKGVGVGGHVQRRVRGGTERCRSRGLVSSSVGASSVVDSRSAAAGARAVDGATGS